MFRNKYVDTWMWFLKRISCFTLWQVPMIIIFWKKSSKIERRNAKERKEDESLVSIFTTDSLYDDKNKTNTTIIRSILGKTTRSNS